MRHHNYGIDGLNKCNGMFAFAFTTNEDALIANDSFWRKADPIVDDNRALLKGGMFWYQRKLWESRSFIKALVGGYGIGKGNIGSKRLIAAALENALPDGTPCPVMAISPSYKVGKRTIIPSTLELLDGRKIPYRYNKSEHEIRLNYRGRQNKIWFGSGEDADSLKGPNLAYAWIDEPFIQERAVFEQMLARVRHPEAKHPELWLTGTPEQLNWGYDITEGDERQKFDLDLVQASTADNTTLDPMYYQRLYDAYDEQLQKAYLHGQFVNLSSGIVYYAFDRTRHVYDRPDPGGPLFIGMDFNVDPMSAVVFWYRQNHIHIIDEIELPNADTETMIAEARAIYGLRLTAAYPDPTGAARKTAGVGGQSDHALLRRSGLTVFTRRPGKPARRDRFNAANMAFRHNRLTISPRCKKLVKGLEQLTHEKYSQELSHMPDAATYSVEFLMPVPSGSNGAVQQLRGA